MSRCENCEYFDDETSLCGWTKIPQSLDDDTDCGMFEDREAVAE